MDAPGAALGDGVVQEGLEAIEGVGVLGFRRLAGLEFFPKLAELAALIGREKAEEAVGGALLADIFFGKSDGVIGEGVAGIDLDDVVDEDHLDGVEEIDGYDGILGHEGGHDGEMPGVLGGVLATGLVGQERLAEDGLELVDFEDEGELLVERGHNYILRLQDCKIARLKNPTTGAVGSTNHETDHRRCVL